MRLEFLAETGARLDQFNVKWQCIPGNGKDNQERLKTEVKLLLSANRKLYVPRRLAQQRMTSVSYTHLTLPTIYSV